jgi:hypothetical protein
MIKWLKEKLLGKGPPEDRQPTSAKTYIWGVVDGPYLRDDFPEEELWDNGIPEEAEAMLVCKVEESGEVFLANYWYGSMDEAYEVKKYFDVNMEPLEIRHD